VLPGTFQRIWLWRALHVAWRPGQGNGPSGSENKSKPMNDTQTSVPYPKPPRLVRVVINSFVTTVLRSRWHRMRSDRLLLLTFTGRKSGREFTTPVRYVQEGEMLRLRVVRSHWWKNLVGEATVHVLLRGEMRTGTAEVLPEEDGEVVVKVHLTG
jgi:F420H(2)-dependent quinone reductase